MAKAPFSLVQLFSVRYYSSSTTPKPSLAHRCATSSEPSFNIPSTCSLCESKSTLLELRPPKTLSQADKYTTHKHARARLAPVHSAEGPQSAPQSIFEGFIRDGALVGGWRSYTVQEQPEDVKAKLPGIFLSLFYGSPSLLLFAIVPCQ
mmetsp:Transcript_10110/g.36978  ORF Transcript_10110/g.36978 Transcript_10110/m.36978 type:complete len:149 (-) Transcript_10110:376-822(-)|eukprot:scaffold1290_cov367-Prasinococcus_capsulatus_cf.AAC.4